MSNYPLRLPDQVLADARAFAERDGSSLNQFLGCAIAEHIGQRKAIDFFERRAARADPVAAAAFWAKVPSGPPVPGDELPED